MTRPSTPEPTVPDRRALLERMLRQRALAQSHRVPMSRGQKALWFIHNSAPESPAYHVAFAARVGAGLDTGALQRAFQGLVDRHPMLRATIDQEGGAPVQRVRGACPVVLELADGRRWSEAELSDHVRAAYERPFDLANGPLFRVHLFQRDAGEHVLLFVVHHIVYDGWSLWMNVDELRQLYLAEVSGRPAALPPIATTFATFVERQEAALDTEEGARHRAFWEEELAGELPPLELPADHARPAVQTYRGASAAFELDADLSERLRAIARERGVTPFVVLVSAYQVLLSRTCGQDEILIGTPTAGRTDPMLSGVVGYFVNPVVLRTELSGAPRFVDVLERMRERVFRAIEHQDCPFQVVVERVVRGRDPSRTPLFQACFALHKPQLGQGLPGVGHTMCWGDLELAFYELAQQEGQFDLELEMVEGGGGFGGLFKYNADLFEPATAERLAAHFVELLRSIAADPGRSVAELGLLAPGEREALLGEAPVPSGISGPEHCLHRRFAAQVAANPEAVAVTCGDDRLTYQELWDRARGLARRLRAQGVGPDVLVGLAAERSVELIVGVLGILAAGGAYVPLDPGSPEERLAFLCADSGVEVLVAQDAVAERLVVDDIPVVSLDQVMADSTEVDDDWESEVSSDHLAYVIYTSGSTGRPKGVLVTHQNVARLFHSTDAWFDFGPDDVWTLFHSFAFDFSVWEIWGALLHGGRLVVVPYDVSRSPDDFRALLAREQVTVLNQTPSAFGQLIEADARAGEGAPLALREVVFGGEALDIRSLAPWFDRHGDQRPRLVNMYGITETTVHVTYRPLTRADAEQPRSVIGRPIPDLALHVLDPHLEPVPVGVAGELYVEGEGLARGYLNRAELSAERFVEHALRPGESTRLYRTGDVARRLADGDLEYLGRIDNQVKIRGFRIELGEIESTLREHPAVAGAVVVAQEHRGFKRLVAYVVPVGGALSVPEVRPFLADRLLSHMVPSIFVLLDAIPLTHNGKVDRRALPAPDDAQGAGEGYVPPRDPLERKLVDMWEEILDVRPIGVRDDFFERGGHSLLAVHLMASIDQTFGCRLPPPTLFLKPTIEQLAAVLRGDVTPEAPSLVVPIQTHGERLPFFCAPGGAGNVLYFHTLAQDLGEAQPFHGLQFVGIDGTEAPLTTIEGLAEAFIPAMKEAGHTGPWLLGGHCVGGLVAFEMAQHLRRLGEEVALVLLFDVPAPNRDSGDWFPTCQDDASWLAKLGEIIAEGSGIDLGLDPAQLRGLDRAGQLTFFSDRMRAAGLLPPGAGSEHVRGLLEVFIANVQMRYAPASTLPVPVALFRAGEAHPDYDFSGAEDPGASFAESTLGWADLSGGPTTVDVVPGTHVTMLRAPHTTELAKAVQARVDEAMERLGS